LPSRFSDFPVRTSWALLRRKRPKRLLARTEMVRSTQSLKLKERTERRKQAVRVARRRVRAVLTLRER
jgi:hypothetical protein